MNDAEELELARFLDRLKVIVAVLAVLIVLIMGALAAMWLTQRSWIDEQREQRTRSREALCRVDELLQDPDPPAVCDELGAGSGG